MKLRGAILGCGMIAEYHLRAWQRIPEVEIVALADTDLERAQSRRAALAPEAVVYPDLESLLAASELDFVDILTPPWLHREQCLRAAACGIHILCQKPLSDRLDEAEALVAELRDYPKLFCVHENHPFRPWFREVKALLREGFFGDEVRVLLKQHDSQEPPEKFKTESEHGILLDYGVHLVAMARELFGDVKEVSADLERINPRVKGESRARARLGFGGLGSVEIDIAWQDRQPFAGEFHIQGTQGEARVIGTLTRGETGRFTIRDGGETIRDETRCPTADYAESFYLFQRQFIDAVTGRAEPPQPATDHLKTLQTVFAAYSAAYSAAISPSASR